MPEDSTVKHISLDREDDRVKSFVRSLPIEAEGSILELEGEALVRVLPVGDHTIDQAKLKTAILKRRDVSRALNEGWRHVDRETGEILP